MATEESKGGGLTGMGWHEKEMYYFFQILFKVFLKSIIWLELSLFD
jgi:hypothetical protein